jgi:hypothetical protein
MVVAVVVERALPREEVEGREPVVGSSGLLSGVVRSEAGGEVVVLPLGVAQRWTRRGWLLVRRCFGICCLLAQMAGEEEAVVSALALAVAVEQPLEVAAAVREAARKPMAKGLEGQRMEATGLERQREEAQMRKRLKMVS